MPKDTKTLCIKKGCASVLTQPLIFIDFQALFYRNLINTILMASPLKLC